MDYLQRFEHISKHPYYENALGAYHDFFCRNGRQPTRLIMNLDTAYALFGPGQDYENRPVLLLGAQVSIGWTQADGVIRAIWCEMDTEDYQTRLDAALRALADPETGFHYVEVPEYRTLPTADPYVPTWAVPMERL